MISGFWRGCSWILDFTYHDTVLFRKVTHNLFNHMYILKKRNHFCFIGSCEVFCSDQCVLDFGEDLPQLMEAKKLCFNWIQVLFCSDQCFLDFGKDIREHLIWLIWTQFCLYQLLILCFTTYLVGENTKGAISYFAPINVFRILVRIFLNTWFHLFRCSYICKSCSYLVWPLI